MASMDDITGWAEEHPVALGAGIFVGGLVLLYLLGYIGGGSSSSTSSSAASNTSLAQAYYAAEAAQTVAGTQLQLGQTAAAAQTAQAQIQANAAQAINAANDAAAVATTQSNNTAATEITASQVQGATNIAANQNATSIITALAPLEIPYTGGSVHLNVPMAGTSGINFISGQSGVSAPNDLATQGWSPAEVSSYMQAMGFGG